MAAYLILDIDVRDSEGYQAYLRGVPAFIAKYGGTYLARGGEAETIEGDWQPGRLVLFRFPDRAAIHALFADPDYAPLRAIRHRCADTAIVAIDGTD